MIARPGSCCEALGVFAMQDLLMLSFTAVFFIVAFLYVKACQKLR